MSNNINFTTVKQLTKHVAAMVFFCLLLQQLNAQNDPYEKLKMIARVQDTIKSQLPKVTISAASSVWKSNAGKPIPFSPIPMTDKNGRAIPSNTILKLPSGKSITADKYFQQLNELKRKANEKGYAFDENKNMMLSELVTPRSELDGRINLLPKPKSGYKTTAEMEKFMDPTFAAGSLKLQPLGKYSSAAERKKVEQSVIEDKGAGNLKVSPLQIPANFPILPGTIKLKPLKTINETSTRDQHFGSANTFLAGLKFSLTRFARVFGSDARHVPSKLSEYRISGNAKAYASILGHPFDVFNADGELYVPADSSKKMTAKIILTVAGINIRILDEQYSQRKLISGIKAQDLDKAVAASFPIIPGLINFTGTVGIKGTIGLEYSGELDRSFTKVELKPLMNIEVYAEAGISDPFDIGTIGVGGDLTFINGNVDLTAWFGIMNQNSAQIILGYGYNLSYNVEFLSGRLYVFYKVCFSLPLVGDYCPVNKSANIFNWSGFRESGTLEDGRYLFFINNGPVITPKTPM